MAVVYHMRTDDGLSVQQMAYRHSYGGFLAQRKNHCFLNKLTLTQSMRLFFKQLVNTHGIKKSLSYAIMTIRLHGTMLKAWIDAGRANRYKGRSATHGPRYLWEGYDHQPTHSAPPAKSSFL
jgi:hypothetical protein